MDLLQNILYGLVGVTMLYTLFLELRRCLTMMQQNSYRPERYRRWLKQSNDTSAIYRLMALVVLFLAMFPLLAGDSIGMFFILLTALYNGVRISRIKYKKPLVFTPRAQRIMGVMVTLSLALMVAVFFLFNGFETPAHGIYLITITALGCFCGSHILAVVSVWVLTPVEKYINNRYINDARRILRSMPDLKVVGITGSYGKTSTKHYLHRILSEHFETLMTPGSYNTTMGVVRTVREMMKPYTEVFIAEMGAKQPGDIKEIADLVLPQISVVTAVGPQHLETFKSIERVADTKFEIVDALPEGGVAVINDDFPEIAKRQLRDDIEVERYGRNAPWHFTDVEYHRDGTTFTLHGPKLPAEGLTLKTRLVGECNVSNLTAAVIVALELGVPVEKIKFAVEQIDQVEHRLSLKRTPGGITIIDDAFNSNPHGSTMALEVLKAMDGGKRILVTPGMVELGEKQYELNKEFGRLAASSADVVIIVNELNRAAIAEGLAEGDMPQENIHPVANFKEAQTLLQGIMQAGDTVLYENDLPDTFK